jgi:hypothetical protein
MMYDAPCEHRGQDLRRRKIAGGGIQLRMQCLVCGQSAGPAISQAGLKLDTFREWDVELQERAEAQRRARAEQRASEALRLREDASYELTAEYQEYLKTPEWREKRAAVMERERGRCQGCRTAPAVEVHHLTYAHVRRELLFELVALCRSCHETAHDLDGRQP